ncbi:MAG: hypothetical protein Q8M71_10175 [Thermodesulfovibrionales bacterium]|nr:hypothetical protein [Thermodesulfovibrionales bacterium]
MSTDSDVVHYLTFGTLPATGTGLELSQEMNDKFQELVDIAADKLSEWGVEMKRKENVPCNTV